MSGHSKWSTIKRKKGLIDAERGKAFQKITKEIIVAARTGDSNPLNNSALRMVIEKARACNMPKSNIESAIQKGSSKSNSENYDAIRYEGYGPGGVAIMIDCLTDNKNRTASFVRSTLTKRGGNLGTDGSVSYLFKRMGLIVLEKMYDEDKLMEDVLSLDVLDLITNEEDYTIYTEVDNFISVKESLINKGYDDFIVSEISFIPDNYLTLDDEHKEKLLKLIEELEDIDDVQNVYHNLEI